MSVPEPSGPLRLLWDLVCVLLGGDKFPRQDEDALWALAAAHRARAEAIAGLSAEPLAAVQGLRYALPDGVGTGIEQAVGDVIEGGARSGGVRQVQDADTQLADWLDDTARDVEFAKLSILSTMAVSIAVFLAAFALAGPAGAVVGALIRQRIASLVGARVVTALSALSTRLAAAPAARVVLPVVRAATPVAVDLPREALEEVGAATALPEWWQIAQGHRDEFDPELVEVAAASTAFGVPLTFGIGHLMRRFRALLPSPAQAGDGPLARLFLGDRLGIVDGAIPNGLASPIASVLGQAAVSDDPRFDVTVDKLQNAVAEGFVPGAAHGLTRGLLHTQGAALGQRLHGGLLPTAAPDTGGPPPAGSPDRATAPPAPLPEQPGGRTAAPGAPDAAGTAPTPGAPRPDSPPTDSPPTVGPAGGEPRTGGPAGGGDPRSGTPTGGDSRSAGGPAGGDPTGGRGDPAAPGRAAPEPGQRPGDPAAGPDLRTPDPGPGQAPDQPPPAASGRDADPTPPATRPTIDPAPGGDASVAANHDAAPNAVTPPPPGPPVGASPSTSPNGGPTTAPAGGSHTTALNGGPQATILNGGPPTTAPTGGPQTTAPPGGPPHAAGVAPGGPSTAPAGVATPNLAGSAPAAPPATGVHPAAAAVPNGATPAPGPAPAGAELASTVDQAAPSVAAPVPLADDVQTAPDGDPPAPPTPPAGNPPVGDRDGSAERSPEQVGRRALAGIEARAGLEGASTEELAAMLRGSEADALAAISERIRQITAQQEAGRRTPTGKRLRWTQLAGAISLIAGKIINMAPGQGKTYTGLAAAARIAATEGNVLMVTSQTSLAQRETQLYRTALESLGFDVVRVDPDQRLPRPDKPTIYWSTVSEVAFYRLKQGESVAAVAPVAVLDEIDSVLVDQARTNYILSRGAALPATRAEKAAVDSAHNLLAWSLQDGTLTEADFGREPGQRGGGAALTDAAKAKLRDRFGSDFVTPAREHHLTMAALARWAYRGNADYIVHRGKLYIIDQVTHQVVFDPETNQVSRWSGGLAKAIERLHGIEVLGDISSSDEISTAEVFSTGDGNFRRVVGMSGTVKPVEDTLRSVYDLAPVDDIPRSSGSKLIVHADQVHQDDAARKAGLLADIRAARAAGYPIVIVAHDNSLVQELSDLATAEGIRHDAVDARSILDAVAAGQDPETFLQGKFDNAGRAVNDHGESNVLIINRLAGRGVDIEQDAAARDRGGLRIVPTAHSAESARVDRQTTNRTARSEDPGEAWFHSTPGDELFRQHDDAQTQVAVIRYVEAADAVEAAATAETDQVAARARAAMLTAARAELDDAEEILRARVEPAQRAADAGIQAELEQRRHSNAPAPTHPAPTPSTVDDDPQRPAAADARGPEQNLAGTDQRPPADQTSTPDATEAGATAADARGPEQDLSGTDRQPPAAARTSAPPAPAPDALDSGVPAADRGGPGGSVVDPGAVDSGLAAVLNGAEPATASTTVGVDRAADVDGDVGRTAGTQSANAVVAGAAVADLGTADTLVGAQEPSPPPVAGLWDPARQERAARAYGVIRRATGDVDAIAGQLTGVRRGGGVVGFVREEIAAVKAHLFTRTHRAYGRVGYFEASPDVAEAWIRLSRGEWLAPDVELIEHELDEVMLLSVEPDASLEQVHRLADSQHPWQHDLPTPTGHLEELDRHGPTYLLRESAGDRLDGGVPVRSTRDSDGHQSGARERGVDDPADRGDRGSALPARGAAGAPGADRAGPLAGERGHPVLAGVHGGIDGVRPERDTALAPEAVALVARLTGARAGLAAEHGRLPTSGELVDRAEVDPADVVRVLRAGATDDDPTDDTPTDPADRTDPTGPDGESTAGTRGSPLRTMGRALARALAVTALVVGGMLTAVGVAVGLPAGAELVGGWNVAWWTWATLAAGTAGFLVWTGRSLGIERAEGRKRLDDRRTQLRAAATDDPVAVAGQPLLELVTVLARIAADEHRAGRVAEFTAAAGLDPAGLDRLADPRVGLLTRTGGKTGPRVYSFAPDLAAMLATLADRGVPLAEALARDPYTVVAADPETREADVERFGALVRLAEAGDTAATVEAARVLRQSVRDAVFALAPGEGSLRGRFPRRDLGHFRDRVAAVAAMRTRVVTAKKEAFGYHTQQNVARRATRKAEQRFGAGSEQAVQAWLAYETATTLLDARTVAVRQREEDFRTAVQAARDAGAAVGLSKRRVVRRLDRAALGWAMMFRDTVPGQIDASGRTIAQLPGQANYELRTALERENPGTVVTEGEVSAAGGWAGISAAASVAAFSVLGDRLARNMVSIVGSAGLTIASMVAFALWPTPQVLAWASPAFGPYDAGTGTAWGRLETYFRIDPEFHERRVSRNSVWNGIVGSAVLAGFLVGLLSPLGVTGTFLLVGGAYAVLTTGAWLALRGGHDVPVATQHRGLWPELKHQAGTGWRLIMGTRNGLRRAVLSTPVLGLVTSTAFLLVVGQINRFLRLNSPGWGEAVFLLVLAANPWVVNIARLAFDMNWAPLQKRLGRYRNNAGQWASSKAKSLFGVHVVQLIPLAFLPLLLFDPNFVTLAAFVLAMELLSNLLVNVSMSGWQSGGSRYTRTVALRMVGAAGGVLISSALLAPGEEAVKAAGSAAELADAISLGNWALTLPVAALTVGAILLAYHTIRHHPGTLGELQQALRAAEVDDASIRRIDGALELLRIGDAGWLHGVLDADPATFRSARRRRHHAVLRAQLAEALTPTDLAALRAALDSLPAREQLLPGLSRLLGAPGRLRRRPQPTPPPPAPSAEQPPVEQAPDEPDGQPPDERRPEAKTADRAWYVRSGADQRDPIGLSLDRAQQELAALDRLLAEARPRYQASELAPLLDRIQLLQEHVAATRDIARLAGAAAVPVARYTRTGDPSADPPPVFAELVAALHRQRDTLARYTRFDAEQPLAGFTSELAESDLLHPGWLNSSPTRQDRGLFDVVEPARAVALLQDVAARDATDERVPAGQRLTVDPLLVGRLLTAVPLTRAGADAVARDGDPLAERLAAQIADHRTLALADPRTGRMFLTPGTSVVEFVSMAVHEDTHLRLDAATEADAGDQRLGSVLRWIQARAGSLAEYRALTEQQRSEVASIRAEQQWLRALHRHARSRDTGNPGGTSSVRAIAGADGWLVGARPVEVVRAATGERPAYAPDGVAPAAARRLDRLREELGGAAERLRALGEPHEQLAVLASATDLDPAAIREVAEGLPEAGLARGVAARLLAVARDVDRARAPAAESNPFEEARRQLDDVVRQLLGVGRDEAAYELATLAGAGRFDLTAIRAVATGLVPDPAAYDWNRTGPTGTVDGVARRLHALAGGIAALRQAEWDRLVRDAPRNEWAGKPVYHVMPDRFDNGDPSIDRAGSTSDDRLVHGHDPDDVAFYMGGDLAGMRRRLPYLQQLGVKLLWTTPLLPNMPVTARGDEVSAAYHGYGAYDWKDIDPHFGTLAEFAEFVAEAAEHGIQVCFDMALNHTASLMAYARDEAGRTTDEPHYLRKEEGETPFQDPNEARLTTLRGVEWSPDDHRLGADFPALDDRSAPYRRTFRTPADAALAARVNPPAFLRHLHNMGDKLEPIRDDRPQSWITDSDMDELLDIFTEHPEVVAAAVDVFNYWIDRGVTVFRIDAPEHMDLPFWQQVVPAVTAYGRSKGVEVFMFGETYADPRVASWMATQSGMSALPVGFTTLIRQFIVNGAGPADVKRFFWDDAQWDNGRIWGQLTDEKWFNSATETPASLVRLVSSHDVFGRLLHYLVKHFPDATDAELTELAEFGFVVQFLFSGSPTVYYGDEQGFAGEAGEARAEGRGGDKRARQRMYDIQHGPYAQERRIGGTDRTDAFDQDHPLYRIIAELSELTAEYPALARGATQMRVATDGALAFSRVDADERVEHVVVLNNSTTERTVAVPTYSAGMPFTAVWPGGATGTVVSDDARTILVTVPARSAVVYRAQEQLAAPAARPAVRLDGPTVVDRLGPQQKARMSGEDPRVKLEVQVDAAGDENVFGQATIAVRRADEERWRILGTDDSRPYQVYADLSGYPAGTELELVAVLKDADGRDHWSDLVPYAVPEPATVPRPARAELAYHREDGDYDGWHVVVDGDVAEAGVVELVDDGQGGRVASVRLAPGDAGRTDTLRYTIVHRDGRTDGHGAFNPSPNPRRWRRSGDPRPYTSLASFRGGVTVHWLGDPGFGIYTKGDGVRVADRTVWGRPLPFGEPDARGWRSAFVPLASVSYGFGFDVVEDRHKPTDVRDNWLLPADQADVYVVQGRGQDEPATIFPTLTAAQAARDGKVVIRFQPPDGDLDGWEVYHWAYGESVPWARPGSPPSGTDHEGLYWVLDREPDATSFDYILRRRVGDGYEKHTEGGRSEWSLDLGGQQFVGTHPAPPGYPAVTHSVSSPPVPGTHLVLGRPAEQGELTVSRAYELAAVITPADLGPAVEDLAWSADGTALTVRTVRDGAVREEHFTVEVDPASQPAGPMLAHTDLATGRRGDPHVLRLSQMDDTLVPGQVVHEIAHSLQDLAAGRSGPGVHRGSTAEPHADDAEHCLTAREAELRLAARQWDNATTDLGKALYRRHLEGLATILHRAGRRMDLGALAAHLGRRDPGTVAALDAILGPVAAVVRPPAEEIRESAFRADGRSVLEGELTEGDVWVHSPLWQPTPTGPASGFGPYVLAIDVDVDVDGGRLLEVRTSDRPVYYRATVGPIDVDGGLSARLSDIELYTADGRRRAGTEHDPFPVTFHGYVDADGIPHGVANANLERAWRHEIAHGLFQAVTIALAVGTLDTDPVATALLPAADQGALGPNEVARAAEAHGVLAQLAVADGSVERARHVRELLGLVRTYPDARLLPPPLAGWLAGHVDELAARFADADAIDAAVASINWYQPSLSDPVLRQAVQLVHEVLAALPADPADMLVGLSEAGRHLLERAGRELPTTERARREEAVQSRLRWLRERPRLDPIRAELRDELVGLGLELPADPAAPADVTRAPATGIARRFVFGDVAVIETGEPGWFAVRATAAREGHEAISLVLAVTEPGGPVRRYRMEQDGDPDAYVRYVDTGGRPGWTARIEVAAAPWDTRLDAVRAKLAAGQDAAQLANDLELMARLLAGAPAELAERYPELADPQLLAGPNLLRFRLSRRTVELFSRAAADLRDTGRSVEDRIRLATSADIVELLAAYPLRDLVVAGRSRPLEAATEPVEDGLPRVVRVSPTVDDEFGPLPVKATTGDPVPVRATLTGTVAAVVVVSEAGGPGFQVPMEEVEPGRWAAAVTFTEIGAAGFHVRARSAAGPDAVSEWQPVVVDRRRGAYISWYEFFPRSTGGFDADGRPRHGTFASSYQELERAAAMGFKVVYLPPIHPIGRVNRKGRENSRTAEPGDVGSPWAVGSAEGGHDAIHPELGTFADFAAFLARAAELGVEVAMDLALQAAPDHPWVEEHPEWFTVQPDGTIAHAENPPKSYEDIYPLNFDRDPVGLYAETLRVVQFWVDAGVKVFRVDNPHTKPLSFWHWLITTVKRRDPDVLFLAEAFTRPTMVRALSRVGFSQTYSYFPWRIGKDGPDGGMTSLGRQAVADADEIRGSDWLNTPDILPEYLRDAPLVAFWTTALLAATTSPSWGVYGPVFELGLNRADAATGTEYEASEKYQLRPDLREFLRRGQVAPVQQWLLAINWIRSQHPALRQMRNLVHHRVDNPNLMAYSKTDPVTGDTIVVVVNFDPHNAQEGTLHLDMAALGFGDDFWLDWQDYVSGEGSTEHGPWKRDNWVRLDPRGTFAHVVTLRPLGAPAPPGTRWFEPGPGRPPEQAELTWPALAQLLAGVTREDLGPAVHSLEVSLDESRIVVHTERLGEQHFAVEVEPPVAYFTAGPLVATTLTTGRAFDPHIVRVRADLPDELIPTRVVGQLSRSLQQLTAESEQSGQGMHRKVLHVSWEFPQEDVGGAGVGGLGQVVVAVTREQARAGHDVIVITREDFAKPGVPAVPGRRVPRLVTTVDGVRVLVVPLPAARDTKQSFEDDPAAWSEEVGVAMHEAARDFLGLIEWHPDVVNVHDYLATSGGVSIAEEEGVPLVVNVHATQAGRWGGWLNRSRADQLVHAAEWARVRTADHVIVNSALMLDEVAHLFSINKRAITVIPNGADLDKWRIDRITGVAREQVLAKYGVSADAKVLLHIGRLQHEKGVQDIIRALPAVRVEHPTAVLLVVGDGDARPALERQLAEAVERGLLGENDVRLLGKMGDERIELAAVADVGVIASHYEPFGVTANEFAAVRLPLVVSDKIGFGAGQDARLVFAHEDAGMIADRVNRALRDPAATAARVERALAEALSPKYDWATIAARYLRVYGGTPRRSITTGPGVAGFPAGNIFATQPPGSAPAEPDPDGGNGRSVR